jgi:hypothetical protein
MGNRSLSFTFIDTFINALGVYCTKYDEWHYESIMVSSYLYVFEDWDGIHHHEFWF